MKKIPTVVLVVAVALLNDAGQVLMQRRRRGAEHGGLWEFPGGKVEVDETLGESLCREICEELGIALNPAALEPLTFATSPDQPHVILLYTCRDWTGEPACLDGEEIAWFAPISSLYSSFIPLRSVLFVLMDCRRVLISSRLLIKGALSCALASAIFWIFAFSSEIELASFITASANLTCSLITPSKLGYS